VRLKAAAAAALCPEDSGLAQMGQYSWHQRAYDLLMAKCTFSMLPSTVVLLQVGLPCGSCCERVGGTSCCLEKQLQLACSAGMPCNIRAPYPVVVLQRGPATTPTLPCQNGWPKLWSVMCRQSWAFCCAQMHVPLLSYSCSARGLLFRPVWTHCVETSWSVAQVPGR
jgi:hypothetical protein